MIALPFGPLQDGPQEIIYELARGHAGFQILYEIVWAHLVERCLAIKFPNKISRGTPLFAWGHSGASCASWKVFHVIDLSVPRAAGSILEISKKQKIHVHDASVVWCSYAKAK